MQSSVPVQNPKKCHQCTELCQFTAVTEVSLNMHTIVNTTHLYCSLHFLKRAFVRGPQQIFNHIWWNYLNPKTQRLHRAPNPWSSKKIRPKTHPWDFYNDALCNFLLWIESSCTLQERYSFSEISLGYFDKCVDAFFGVLEVLLHADVWQAFVLNLVAQGFEAEFGAAGCQGFDDSVKNIYTEFSGPGRLSGPGFILKVDRCP